MPQYDIFADNSRIWFHNAEGVYCSPAHAIFCSSSSWLVHACCPAVIVLFNKPCGVLCQFTDHASRPTLADYIDIKNIYAAGRLDRDSEGLLVLTDDGSLQNRITSPKHKMQKTYLVQVENRITEAALQQLRQGVVLRDGLSLPAKARRIDPPAWLWPREPPVRQRKNIPTSWIELSLREGRNRQVRRMTAATGFPTLRLIRIAIGPWQLQRLGSGEYVVIRR